MRCGMKSQVHAMGINVSDNVSESNDNISEESEEMIEDMDHTTYNNHSDDEMNEKNYQNTKIIQCDLDSLFAHIKTHSNPHTISTFSTSEKYCVILYGPPASGKSIARNIAVHWIKKQMQENNISEHEIMDTFIDTNVDDIVYKLEANDGIEIKEKLTKISNNIINPFNDSMTDGDKIKIAKKEINELVRQSSSVYFSKRSDADIISELLYYVAAFLRKNIFIEISSGNTDYIEHHILDFCKWYNYIPVLIYPFVKSVNILCDRMHQRALIDGRYISCDDMETGLRAKMISTFEACDKIIKTIDRKAQNYLILMYKADNFDSIQYDKIVNNDFSGFDEYFSSLVLEYVSKYNDNQDSFKSFDFETMTEFNMSNQ